MRVNSSGDITTYGNHSTGIFAEQNGYDGAVTVTSNGDVTTFGESSDGIFAEQKPINSPLFGCINLSKPDS